MNDIKLSVIIPAYNVEDYVSDAVCSVLDAFDHTDTQSGSIEILIVNDGSTDGTAGVVDELIKKTQVDGVLIRAIHQENRGHGGAINAGTDAVGGEYVMVLDADDTLFPDGIADFYDAVDKNAFDLMIFGEDKWYEDSDDVEHNRVPRELLSNEGAYERSHGDLKFVTDNWNTGLRAILNMHCMVFNTSFYRSLNIKLPEKVYYDDAYYYIVAAACAKNILLSGSLLYRYRLGNPGQSVAPENRVKRIEHHEIVIDAILSEYDRIKNMGEYAFLYYRLRLTNVVTDYLVTALLRCGDRPYGRKRARKMLDRFKGKDIPRIKRNYHILFFMNLMHMGEKQFDRLILKK